MGLAECRCGFDATRGAPLRVRCDPRSVATGPMRRPAYATRGVSLRVAGYSAAANIWWRIFDDLAFGREGLTDAVVQPVLRDRLGRSEEHTSELQSRGHLVCRLLLEKKKTKTN